MLSNVAVTVLASVIALTACSNGAEPGASSASALPTLPTNSSERVLIQGKMVFWMYEGEGGCFGTLDRGSDEVQLWIDANACGEREFTEGEQASVVVTFRSDEQWDESQKSYTIVEFK
ncbi:MAG TPA: hypothetical protein VFN29_02745 [Chiayiivirga sp.]|nr:hypothetical protein [Chiayiivirga sp.]